MTTSLKSTVNTNTWQQLGPIPAQLSAQLPAQQPAQLPCLPRPQLAVPQLGSASRTLADLVPGHLAGAPSPWAPTPQRQSGATGAKTLNALDLYPKLTPRVFNTRPKLSDDGFFDSVVSLALCQGLNVSLGTTNGSSVSYRALATANLGVHAAWNAAAYNVAKGSLCRSGIGFFHRPWQCGLQFRSESAPISSWITHPVLFNIFHKLAGSLLGTSQIKYLIPAADTVLAVIGSTRQANRLNHLAQEQFSQTAPQLSVKPLIWANGFPRPL